MAEISREEAIKNLKKWHENEQLLTYKKAISDMEKLDRIENTRPIDLIKEFGDLGAEKFNKISHWFSQAQKLEQIEKIVKCDECVSEEGDCKHDGDCNHHKIEVIEQIIKGE